jgi:hypothetical protein
VGAPGDPFHLSAQLAYVYAQVTQDLLFDETEGRNILAGANTRHAALLGLRTQLGQWFDALVNVGWAHATLDSTGERLPYVPEWIVRVDAAVQGGLSNWQIGGIALQGRLGVGLTYMPGRPLPFGEFGDAFWLLNAGAELRLWQFSLGVQARNLLNQRFRQSEFNYASNFTSSSAPPSRLPVRHFVAGEPIFALITLTWHAENTLRAVWESPE